ncbi:division/cell wall cluster transcriptional repressor MraZ [Pseudoroseicyclus sp. CXY001]|uniref:division/cell wall cluster transcriptional repressor MraZ n=1 Tax=Pseudoroseicyclus sp. CXY001 TaxID=3242492 RepID=UPI00358DD6CE
MSTFTGQIEQKLDGKGRLSIPAAYRAVLEQNDAKWEQGKPARLAVQHSRDLKGYLKVWTMDRITEIREGIEKMPEGPHKKGLAYLYSVETTDVSLDKDGRMVLPQRMRDKLDVEGEAPLALLGYGRYFEIWRDEATTSREDEVTSWLDSIPDGVDPLSFIDSPPE